MKAFANLSKCAVLTLVSVGLLSAAPCPTATADVYVSSFGTGKGACTITATTASGGTAQLTISQFTVVNVGYGLPASDLLITPLTDSNGIGFQITPTVPWTPSVTYKLDDEVQYIATVTSAAVDWPGIDRIYTELNGTATAPGFDQVVEVYCPGGFTLPPDQACPATQGKAQTLYAGPTPAGTGTTVIFAGGLYSAGPHGVCTGAFSATSCVYSSIAVNKDMDANASLGGSATITLVKNQLGPPITTRTVPQGSCQPSSSLSALVTGKNVISYIPKGNWSSGSTGISAVNVEGASIVPTKIATTNVVNSCASNSKTLQTVCTANNTDVYLLTGTTLNSTLNSAGSGTIRFSGGTCTNCGVAMDAVHGKALISLSLAGVGGFQLLDLAGSTFEPAFASKAPTGFFTNISEDPLIDPTRNILGLNTVTGNGNGALLLSASEPGGYEIIDLTASTTPAFFENTISGGVPDSSAEDCTTGIALSPLEFNSPTQVYLADLTQAHYIAGSPGTWTAPSQVQTLSESFMVSSPTAAGPIAVAQGPHIGFLATEFGGNTITAFLLPATSGVVTPAITDWVSCNISGFSDGFDPHTITAYQSPNSNDAIGLLANGTATSLAVVDLTKVLNPAIVPRTVAGHGCASGTLPASVVSFVSVP